MDFKFIPARWFTPSEFREIWWIIMHTMESPETAQTAENVAHWFAGLGSDRKVSAHYNVDCDSIVQSVRDKDVAYGAPGANRHGLHIEQAGYAAQSAADWSDSYSKAMLTLSAGLVAAKCREYGIPPVWLSPAELRAGSKGISSHANCSKAFGGSHTDPGAGFPRDEFIAAVRAHLEPAQDMQVKETVLSALRIVYGQPVPPSVREKLDILRDDPWFPPRT